MDRSSIWCLDLLYGGKIMPYHTGKKKKKKTRKGGKKKKKMRGHHGC